MLQVGKPIFLPSILPFSTFPSIDHFLDKNLLTISIFPLSKSLIAENKLNKFIDEVSNKNKLSFNNIALVGFSQGCMIAIQTALKKKDQIKCVIGYSGKILNIKHLNQNINSKPEIFLMHGDSDAVVPANFLLEAKEFFNKNDYKIQTKIFENCEHRIPTEGSSIGLEFLKKNLYK